MVTYSDDWFSHGATVFGSWEPLMVLRKWNRDILAETEEYEFSHTEAAFALLHSLGCNFFITHYHKGFGWETEREERERVKTQVEFAHKYGIRIGVYFRVDNLIGETFFLERPEARDWVARDIQGQTIHMGGCSWREHICFNALEYRGYAKQVIRYAVEELGVDAIHFDGCCGKLEPMTCKCPRCREGFRAFLVEHWGEHPTAAEAYFGHTRLEGIQIPDWNTSVSVGNPQQINTAVTQEWIRYKCALFADFHRDLSDYLHGLNPKMVMVINSGICSWLNAAADLGMHLPLVAPNNDGTFIEDGHFPGLVDGILCHRIRDYTIAQHLGQQAITYSHFYDPHDFILSIAETMAFNRGHLGHIGFLGDAVRIDSNPEQRAILQQVVAWRDQRRHLYQGTENTAEVGVLRGFASMAFDMPKALAPTMLIEQTLIQRQIPYDTVFDEDLDLLDRYRVVVLAGQSRLSTEDAGKIARYVAAGGNLVITGNSGEFDELSHRYRDNILIERMQLPIDAVTSIGESVNPALIGVSTGIMKRRLWPETPRYFEKVLGGGKVAYLPRIIPGVDKENWHPDWQFDATLHRFRIPGESPNAPLQEYPFCNWKLPQNASELTDAIRWAGDLTITVIAPEHVAVCWTRQPATGTEFLHLVNYQNRQTLRSVEIVLPAGHYRDLRMHIFDPEPLDVSIDITDRCVRVPPFASYTVIELGRKL